MVSAHGGGLDSNGGHNCYVSPCAGTYHYHRGGGSSSGSSYTPQVTLPEITIPSYSYTPRNTIPYSGQEQIDRLTGWDLNDFERETYTTSQVLRESQETLDEMYDRLLRERNEELVRQTAAEPVTRNDSNDEFFLVIGALIVGGLLVLVGIGIGKRSK